MYSSDVKARKVSDVLAEKLESMILEGSLSPGQKLPAERELATQFDVSRPSLREALQKLEAKSLLIRRQGGGTFIADDIGMSFVDPLGQLFKSHPEFNYDLLEFRHALEEVAAHYAALRATEDDLILIEQRYQQWLDGHEHRIGAEQEAELDWRFHLSIAEASHNAVLLHSMRALFDLFKQTIASNLEYLYRQDDRRNDIQQQHWQIKQAIIQRDPHAAQQAVNDHLAFVEEALQQSSRHQTHAQRSLRRIGLMRRD